MPVVGSARIASLGETAPPWSDGTSATAPNRFLQMKGIRFAYRAFGQKAGVPLLLLAPFRGTMDSWDPELTDGFARRRPVILFDNVGVGLTSGTAPTTIAQMARDTETFIDALRELHLTDPDWRTGHVDLLGLSLGGFVAQELALNRADIVERVVLAGTAPQGSAGIATPLPEVARWEMADVQTPDDALSLLFARSDASQAAGRAFLARLGSREGERDAPVKSETVLAQAAAMRAWGNTTTTRRNADLTRIKQPVLVADGDADIVMPTDNSRALAGSLSNVRLLIYPDSGHAFLFQYPDAFVKDVSEFLQRP